MEIHRYLNEPLCFLDIVRVERNDWAKMIRSSFPGRIFETLEGKGSRLSDHGPVAWTIFQSRHILLNILVDA
jgi:hypothetical protein